MLNLFTLAKTTAVAGSVAALGFGLLVWQPQHSQAQTPAPVTGAPTLADMTDEEKAEREARKSCKVAICAAMRTRKPSSDVSCNVIKTWRKEHLNSIVSKAGASWPWGNIKCTAPIKLQREMLEKALGDGKYEATLDKHEVHCVVEQSEGAKSDIRFEFTPKVAFENGKAVKATLNWGKIEAPTLVKGAMWTATATDNTFNVLQSTVVEDINDFTSARCDEVKDEWDKK